MFKDKKLLITGGTGSFGNAVLRRCLNSDIAEIRIFSRDEKKQGDMRKSYNNPKLKFFIGDIREYDSIYNACRGIDYVFHAAALKQVPSCEFYPLQAIRTNILGTENLLSAAISHNVKKVVCLSTDKAVYPINTMGMSKALMEKVMIAKSRSLSTTNTIICGTRYGNVMASRGSVIPLFLQQLQDGRPLTLTNPDMTRFMMSLEQAVELVLFAFEHGANGDIFVQKSPASTIGLLAKSILKLFNMSENNFKIIGTRHGEKLYESLLTNEEMVNAIDLDLYYRIPADIRDLNYDGYYSEGSTNTDDIEEYNSHNTYQLSETELINLLKKLPLVSNMLLKYELA